MFFITENFGRILPEEDFAPLKPEEIPAWAQNPYLHVFSFESSNGPGFNIDFGIDGHYWQFNKKPCKTKKEVITQFESIDRHLYSGDFHLRETLSHDLSLVLVESC